jgi:ABC-2 type transport system ATP-binding protein
VASRLRGETAALRAALKTEILAELEGAQKRFGTLVALHALDLQIVPGELLSLLGPNGAGKSTAISLLIGLSRPDAGRAFLFGRSPHDIEARRQIGVMLQAAELIPELRVRELIALTSKYYPEPMELDEALAVSGIGAVANRPCGKLSGGQRRQVQFALAICGRPRLLFLDEPTAGLDVEARELMWATLRHLVAQGVAPRRRVKAANHWLRYPRSSPPHLHLLSMR